MCPNAARLSIAGPMRDHYHGFSHPVLVDLPAEPPSDLFGEMDVVAGELRSNPEFIVADDQIAFRQLQKLRGPQDQWLDLFAVWRERYDGKQAAKASAASARLAALSAEREALFEQRASSSSSAERDAATARIEAIWARACRASCASARWPVELDFFEGRLGFPARPFHRAVTERGGPCVASRAAPPIFILPRAWSICCSAAAALRKQEMADSEPII